MIEAFVSKFLMEIIVLLILSIVSTIIKFYQLLSQLETRQDSIEQLLFGYEESDNHNGFVDTSKNRMDRMEDNLEDIDEQMKEINFTLKQIEKDLNTQDKDE